MGSNLLWIGMLRVRVVERWMRSRYGLLEAFACGSSLLVENGLSL